MGLWLASRQHGTDPSEVPWGCAQAPRASEGSCVASCGPPRQQASPSSPGIHQHYPHLYVPIKKNNLVPLTDPLPTRVSSFVCPASLYLQTPCVGQGSVKHHEFHLLIRSQTRKLPSLNPEAALRVSRKLLEAS